MTPRHRIAGFIVLIVMVVIVMLSLAGLAFVLNLSLENQAVHLQGDQQQLQQTVASGVELMRGFLAQSPARRQQAGGTHQNDSAFAAVSLAPDATSSGETRFSIVSPQEETEASGGLRFGLQNESARLNLSVLLDWESDEPGAAGQALMQLPEMTEAIADAILDWIDGDDVPRPSGAEADYYVGQGLPYQPRNHVPAVLEELLLVRDVSRIHLLGADTNVNFRQDASEAQQTGGAPGAASAQTPWVRLLTLYSAEANRTFQGQPRIDLNQEELSTLHEQLEQAFDRRAADFVVAYRQFGPYDPLVSLFDLPAASPGADAGPGRKPGSAPRRPGAKRTPADGQGVTLDLARPPEHRIESILDLIEARVFLPPEPEEESQPPDEDLDNLLDDPDSLLEDVVSQLDPSLEVENPFQQQRDALRDYLPQWYDLTTTVDAPVIRGRINVNQAARPVLAGIPGLDESLADRIIAARDGFSTDAAEQHRYPIWLYAEGLVDRQQMRRLEPYLTCGGDVFRAQVVAFGGRSGLVARAEVVLDASVSPPRQVYWKDLGLLGRGFTDRELGLETSWR
jgi:type II secretory pathway component PulK